MQLKEGSLRSPSKTSLGVHAQYLGKCRKKADFLYSVGAHFILGSWYKRSELGIRAAVFCVFGHIGTMAGGWIQAGLLASLAGKGGLPAWKWIFIIVSVMTIPVALFGMFYSDVKPPAMGVTDQPFRMGIHP